MEEQPMTWDHLHDEDVLFEFRGHRPDQLTPGRFYRGTVDGFAEFGVFVTVGDSVTGLLHRSNIDGRLENLEWEVGDEVIVQVEGVRENGNVDLAWSIRQSPEEFRGDGVHDPDGEGPEETPAEPEGEAAEESMEEEQETSPESSVRTELVEAVSDVIGDRLRLTGKIADVRQTEGPTIFTLVDETGEIECAAFEAAGVRAFPDIDGGSVVEVIGRAERHRGALQLETEEMHELEEEDREDVLDRIETAEEERAQPERTELVVEDADIEAVHEELIETATRLRRAVSDGRSVIIRHPTTVDGVVAGAALEHALRTLTARKHEEHEAGAWFVTRRPMEDAWYDLGDAMYDVTDGTDRDAHLVLVGAGGSQQDAAARSFLEVYDISPTVIDALETPLDAVTPLATNVAGMVDETVREDLVHLPAIARGSAASGAYLDLATEHGYDPTSIRERHEAIALVAYYHRFDDKRELIADLLFDGEEAGELAAHISGQFRQRLEAARETALANGERLERGATDVFVLDAATLTHRFSFPPRPVLAEALTEAVGSERVVMLDEDEAFFAGAEAVDLDELAGIVDDRVPDAVVRASRDRLTFLAGRRDDVREAIVDTLGKPAA